MQTHQTGRTLEITLLQERSAGTFARVHLARVRDPEGLTRFVAVKVLKERWADSSDVLDRTRDEAQLLASLQHQNIVRVEAITEINGQPAIVMEFVHGADLGELITVLSERNTPFPFQTVFEIAERATSALAAAYFKVPIGMAEPLHVVHRDLKPSNIMLTVEGSLRVLDFGTARFEDERRIAKTQEFRFGSLKYMSPERREGDRGDHASDVYSLGLVVIELLLGRSIPMLPHNPETHDQIVSNLIDTVPSFGLPNTGWDNSLRETLLRMVACDPKQRLDARQAVKLFRAFKEQADGDSLASFAEGVVTPVTNELFALPDMSQEEGTKIWLNTTDNSAVVDTTTIPNLDPFDGGERTDVSVKKGASLPVGLFGPAMDTEEAMHSASLRPGFATRDLTTEDMDHTEEDLPIDDLETDAVGKTWPSARPTDHGPVTAPQPRPLPTIKPAERKGPAKRYILLGCVTALIVITMTVATALAIWNLFIQEMVPDLGSPRASKATQNTEAAEADAVDPRDVIDSSVTVALHSGDPTVQWIRLMNAAGDRVLTAKPDAEGPVAPGDYTISVKVVARTVLSGALDITEDTALTCKPATMGRIRCTDKGGSARIVLKP